MGEQGSIREDGGEGEEEERGGEGGGGEGSYCVNGVASKIAGAYGSLIHLWNNIVAFDVEEERLFSVGSPVVLEETRDARRGHESHHFSVGVRCNLLTWAPSDYGLGVVTCEPPYFRDLI